MIFLNITVQPQSGNWIKDYGGLISPMVALSLFFLTQFLTKQKERRSKRKIQTEKLNYLAVLVNGSLTNLDSNIANLEERLSLFDKNKHKFHLLNWYHTNDIERIVTKLNLEEYFLAYITRYGNNLTIIREYRTLISSIDTLYETNKNIFNTTIKAQDNDTEIRFNIKHLTEEIDKEVFSINDSLIIIYPRLSERIIELLPAAEQTKSGGNIKAYEESYIAKLFDCLFEIKDKLPRGSLYAQIISTLNIIRRFSGEVSLVYKGIELRIQETEEFLKILREVQTQLINNSARLLKLLLSRTCSSVAMCYRLQRQKLPGYLLPPKAA